MHASVFTRVRKYAGLVLMAMSVLGAVLGLGSGIAQAQPKHPVPHPFIVNHPIIANHNFDRFVDRHFPNSPFDRFLDGFFHDTM